MQKPDVERRDGWAESATEYMQAASEFVQAVHDLKIIFEFDWSKWAASPSAKRLVGPPHKIDEATPDQLFRLVTTYVRGDRFNEGMFDAAFDSGILAAIVRRSEVICQTFDSEFRQ